MIKFQNNEWYGIKDDGSVLHCSHQDLSNWGKNNDVSESIENNNYFEFSYGLRIIRGGDFADMVKTAKNLGWDNYHEWLFGVWHDTLFD